MTEICLLKFFMTVTQDGVLSYIMRVKSTYLHKYVYLYYVYTCMLYGDRVYDYIHVHVHVPYLYDMSMRKREYNPENTR